MAIKIVIDSASDIDLEEAQALGVTLVPMEIQFSDEKYSDGVTLSHKEFFEKLVESADLPKTSQINPYSFEEKFAPLVEAGHEVIAITISSKLSGTFRNAQAAAKKFGKKVFAVDSLNASIGERLLCLYALRLIEEEKTAEEIVRKLEKAKKRINLIAVLDTLKYLKKGGRISALTAFAGEMLSIKPVIGIIDGTVKVIGKAIGSKKGNNLLNTLVREKRVDFTMPYGVIWSGLDDAMLVKYLKDSEHLWRYQTENVPSYLIGSTIGTHIGPGGIGVAFFSEERGE